MLDGDTIRTGLNSDLGFSAADRAENIRRLAHTAALLAQSGCTAIVSAISPFAADRALAAEICRDAGCAFTEIFIDTPPDECIRRDPKGLYKKAISGQIKDFTGISSPYEAPEQPGIVIKTEQTPAHTAARSIADYARLLTELDSVTDFLCDTAIQAGNIIMDIYKKDFDVEYKADKSPLTQADLAADRFIHSALDERFPLYAVLSEETADEPSRLDNPYCFIVDPLDGTKEFVKKNGEFTVNIALSFCGTAICGVVYAPALDRLFYAAEGFGAFSHGGGQKRFCSGDGIRVSSRRDALTVMMSRSHASDALVALLDANKEKTAKIIRAGSSLKGCMIAAGEADVYYRLGPTCEWDTAAMQCIVEQAGGILRQGDGSPMTYNRADTLNSKGFYILNSGENAFSPPGGRAKT